MARGLGMRVTAASPPVGDYTLPRRLHATIIVQDCAGVNGKLTVDGKQWAENNGAALTDDKRPAATRASVAAYCPLPAGCCIRANRSAAAARVSGVLAKQKRSKIAARPASA